jgi:hypothetical protein
MSIELETSVPVDAFAAYEAIHLFPRAEVEPPTPPPLNTAQDLLEWVLNDPLRNKNQCRNGAAAIKWLGKVDGTQLSAVPLEVRYLVDNRIKLIREHKPLCVSCRPWVEQPLRRIVVAEKAAMSVTIGAIAGVSIMVLHGDMQEPLCKEKM